MIIYLFMSLRKLIKLANKYDVETSSDPKYLISEYIKELKDESDASIDALFKLIKSINGADNKKKAPRALINSYHELNQFNKLVPKLIDYEEFSDIGAQLNELAESAHSYIKEYISDRDFSRINVDPNDEKLEVNAYNKTYKLVEKSEKYKIIKMFI